MTDETVPCPACVEIDMEYYVPVCARCLIRHDLEWVFAHPEWLAARDARVKARGEGKGVK